MVYSDAVGGNPHQALAATSRGAGAAAATASMVYSNMVGWENPKNSKNPTDPLQALGATSGGAGGAAATACMVYSDTVGSAPPAASSRCSGWNASGAGPDAARGELSSEAAGRMTPSASPRVLHSLTACARVRRVWCRV